MQFPFYVLTEKTRDPLFLHSGLKAKQPQASFPGRASAQEKSHLNMDCMAARWTGISQITLNASLLLLSPTNFIFSILSRW